MSHIKCSYDNKKKNSTLMFPVGEFHYEIMNDLMLKKVYKQYEKMKVF